MFSQFFNFWGYRQEGLENQVLVTGAGESWSTPRKHSGPVIWHLGRSLTLSCCRWMRLSNWPHRFTCLRKWLKMIHILCVLQHWPTWRNSRRLHRRRSTMTWLLIRHTGWGLKQWMVRSWPLQPTALSGILTWSYWPMDQWTNAEPH